ncbi:MAG: anaerobic glycerol-3-phosphate dehydrogenase subunit A [Firmicutes bacterium]|nr:anaerobic glycerol-3-phosphate dehydrogenase subunit A [Bacillota bacterium]
MEKGEWVVVIGGGSTGTGIARDLAMRGVPTTLIEMEDLASGTTGRCHGLLHSGGRYVVADPATARECIEENRILRRIAPHCIEDTGGLFVAVTDEDLEYLPRFLSACRKTGLPAEEISVREALAIEPHLSPRIQAAVRVPDASVDPFRLAVANAAGAREYGAEILRHTKVVGLVKEGDAVAGVRVAEEGDGRERVIRSRFVVNAAGAWSGKIAGMAGISLELVLSKGTLLIFNHRIVNTVINHCHPAGDGDIIVPAGTVSILGTTSVTVPEPDHDRYGIEDEEIPYLLEKGSAMAPFVRSARVIRAFAGVRPLFEGDEEGQGHYGHGEHREHDDRAVSRNYVIIDHETVHGIKNFLTVTGGKLTTYRRMAEAAADVACARLGVAAACRTAGEGLPGVASTEKPRNTFTICECEFVPRAEIQDRLEKLNAADSPQPPQALLADLRRRTRIGMGTCQGAYCGYRTAGVAHETASFSAREANWMLAKFLQERWKGTRPVLWGDQAREAALVAHIYRGIFNIDEKVQ